MSNESQLSANVRLNDVLKANGRSADRALKNFRYVVATVNDDALRVWSDLWGEFQEVVTPGGMVLPKAKEGFTPSCGWPEFLEKLWLLKHYLDCIHRFCNASTTT